MQSFYRKLYISASRSENLYAVFLTLKLKMEFHLQIYPPLLLALSSSLFLPNTEMWGEN